MLLFGVGAFAVLAVDVVLINHLGGVSVGLLCAFVGVGLVALFVLSGATPAALGLLADVSEGFEEDRSAIMGLYSVFLGLGQVIGALLGGIAATWRGIDGLVVATAVLLAIGIAALLRLRSHEALAAAAASLRRTDAQPLRSAADTLSNVAGSGAGPSVAAVKEER
jgi:MFS family permease